MRTLKLLLPAAFLLLISCEDEKINKFNSILGTWSAYEQFREIDGEPFAPDSAGWGLQLAFFADSSCFYKEYNPDLDSVAVNDTGRFYISHDSLYIIGVSPVFIGFNMPLRGKLIILDGDEMSMRYKIVNESTGAVAKIERFFERVE